MPVTTPRSMLKMTTSNKINKLLLSQTYTACLGKVCFNLHMAACLFFDEIADLSLHMQLKLLRAIQEKSIRPVGSQTETPVDIRLLSATHKNLEDAIATASMR